MVQLTEYELEREKKIAANKSLLQSLGLDNISTILATRSQPKKRRQEPASDSEGDRARNVDGPQARARKAARVAVPEGVDGNGDGTPLLRRSSRNASKKVDYTGVEQDRSARTYRVSTRAQDTMGSEPRDANKRTRDPKQYGNIPGVAVGTWWETRQACSADAVHAPWVGGISSGPKGAYSVALSGGYDDDVDLGVAFTYTGSGGRDLKGTKDKPKNLRTAPQSSDQTFENHFNNALKMSAEKKLPIRVIRGFKLRSPYAPAEGYRYDGLYTVEKAWQEVGLNTKYLVCKYAFKRLPGQPPLAVGNANSDGDEDAQIPESSSTQIDAEEADAEGEEA